MSLGPNGRPQTKEKAAVAELLPHIMDLQTESQSCLCLTCLQAPAQQKLAAKYHLTVTTFALFLKEKRHYI